MRQFLMTTAAHIDDTSPLVARFLRYDYGKNAALLPEGSWRVS